MRKAFDYQMGIDTLPERLKYVREEKMTDVSQEKLAAMVTAAGFEVKGHTVMRYEAGTRKPPAEYVRIVADLAGVDPGWLLAGGRESPNGQPVTPAEPTPEEVRDALSRHRQANGEGVGWMARLVEKVIDAEGDLRTKLGLVEAIGAVGRVHVGYGEAMAAVQRGVVMEAESGAANGRNEVNRIEAEGAAKRTYPHGEPAPVVAARKPGEEGGEAQTGSG